MADHTTMLNAMADDMSFLLDSFQSNHLLLDEMTGSRSELQQMFESDSLPGVNESDLSTADDVTVKAEHSYAITRASSSENPPVEEDVLLSRSDSFGTWNNDIVPDGGLAGLNESWVDSLFNPLTEKDDDDVIKNNVPKMGDYEHEQEERVEPCLSPGDISGTSDIDVMSPDSTDPACPSSTNSRSRKRKPSGTSTFSDSGNPQQGFSSKNAIAARENRIKKKRYLEDLEKKNVELEEEKRVMLEKTTEQERRIKELEEKQAYLENILHNQSALSSLLGSLPSSSGVRLSIAGQRGERKRRRAGNDEVIPKMSRGVCLHVDGQTASLEFCSKCAIMAKGGSP